MRLSPAIALVGTLTFSMAAEGEATRDWELVLDEILACSAEGGKQSTTVLPVHHRAPRPEVQAFTQYFRNRGKLSFAKARQRLDPLRIEFEKAFLDEGLPSELVWIGLVESAFDAAARSPVGAVGIWQLMPATAEAFSLRIAPFDERLDRVKSARAAARYLRQLRDEFSDWKLTLAAYNSGRETVRHAIMRFGTTDFWALTAKSALPRETIRYVTAVLAAIAVGAGTHFDDRSPEGYRKSDRVIYATFDASRE